ncbi:hypothetical protein BN1263150019 [Stenotrophomonas thermophila]|nr:hypothetical protein BN1263150019 [Stenotrophomonas maltophilia]
MGSAAAWPAPRAKAGTACLNAAPTHHARGSPAQAQALIPGAHGLRYHYQSSFECITADMIELNPVRQRITDLTDRVLSLRGYL